MILVVDDDPSVTASLTLVLKQAGYRSRSAASPREAVERLEHETFDLVLQDLNFSRDTAGEEGLALLREIRALRPALPVILITAWGSIDLAVRGVRAGALDFLTKPWKNDHLLRSIETALSLADARTLPARSGGLSREQLDARGDFAGIAGRDPSLMAVLEIVARAAPTEASVLITGESGTGKELIAEAVHRNSRRRGAPFVKVNLGGVLRTLFDSEMFGHVRGAFTDALSDRKGRFETAAGGTIFLDEVGDLDLACQVKLLRVLQDRTFEVLGSSATRHVDVRVVSATNRDLPSLVEKSEFREDLLYRLNLIAVHLPPLRERRSDIPALASHFLAAVGRAYQREGLSIGAGALQWLVDQPWPGNVRQMKQLLERTVILTSRDVLETEDFARTAAMPRPEPAAPRGGGEPLPGVGSMTLDEVEKAMILRSLNHHDGNLSRTAESLGISRTALYRRLEKYGIKP